jgi:F-type H+-transporting ATPase subunit a
MFKMLKMPMFKMPIKLLRAHLAFIVLALFCAATLCTLSGHTARAQDSAHGTGPTQGNVPAGSAESASANSPEHAVDAAGGEHGAATAEHGAGTGSHAAGGAGGEHGAGGHEEHEPHSTFDPHQGTWLNPLARVFSREPKPEVDNTLLEKEGEFQVTNIKSIRYDYLVITLLGMILVAALWVIAARRVTLRADGKPNSMGNVAEAMLEGFQNYLIGVMGRDLALRYTPLIASFFFTILFFNWLGLVPGMLAPTANPNIPIALAICAFFCIHIIAIKEVGVKAWAMHFVGEPVWLAPLNIVLHGIGELVKPVSLSIRLLCNVFGEEMVIAQIAGLAIAALASLGLPPLIPFQLPIMMLGLFFGFLQALVFSTLLSIYIATMSTHHGDHDSHNAHGHTEHVHVHGHDEIIAHPTQASLA